MPRSLFMVLWRASIRNARNAAFLLGARKREKNAAWKRESHVPCERKRMMHLMIVVRRESFHGTHIKCFFGPIPLPSLSLSLFHHFVPPPYSPERPSRFFSCFAQLRTRDSVEFRSRPVSCSQAPSIARPRYFQTQRSDQIKRAFRNSERVKNYIHQSISQTNSKCSPSSELSACASSSSWPSEPPLMRVRVCLRTQRAFYILSCLSSGRRRRRKRAWYKYSRAKSSPASLFALLTIKKSIFKSPFSALRKIKPLLEKTIDADFFLIFISSNIRIVMLRISTLYQLQ